MFNIIDLINETTSSSFILSDLVRNMNSGSRADGFFLGDKYYLKTNNKDYEYEKKALITLKDSWYVPHVYLFDDQTKSILMENIRGLSISNYVQKKQTLPKNLIDVICDIENDMLEHNCKDWDQKLEELIWTEDRVKKVDYGQTEVYPDQDNLKDFFKEEIKKNQSKKEAILLKEPNACDEFKRKLLMACGVDYSITEKFLSEL